MQRRRCAIASVLTALVSELVLCFDLCHADWPSSNKLVCGETADQTAVTSVSDGSGGSFLAWLDIRNGTQDIYVQHISGTGALLWAATGVPLCTAIGDQRKPSILPDGSGGAFFAWMDGRSGVIGDMDVYVQRVNVAGVPQWTADGVALAVLPGSQDDPRLVSDGGAGAIVTWEDARSGENDIYVQRVNGVGVPQWTAGGVGLCVLPGVQKNATCTTDGAGGAIVTWRDARSGVGTDDVYAGRISPSGAPLWAANGVPVCTAIGKQAHGTIVSDGAGGAFIAWDDKRAGNYEVYAQRINSAGETQWTADGVAVCAAPNDQDYPSVVRDGSGGIVIAWSDARTGVTDIYAQRLNPTGVPQWAANGVAICAAAGIQSSPTVASDGAGGAIIAWQDARSGFGDVYAQRVNASGAPQWTSDGAAVCAATGAQQFPQIVPDASGGAILSWEDSRSGLNFDIYAQRINGSGSTVDVPMVEDGVQAWLGNAAPNPAVKGTTIRFAVPRATPTSLAIFDSRGRRVRDLVSGVRAGQHSVYWDGHDSAGRRVPNGLYFYRLETDRGSLSGRLSMIR